MMMSVVGPLLLVSWVAATVGGESSVLWWLLTPVLGLFSFALGSSLIMRTIARAGGAPTLNGACATTAMNLGALVGPVIGGIALHSLGLAGPTIVSAGFILLATVVLCAGPGGQSGKFHRSELTASLRHRIRGSVAENEEFCDANSWREGAAG